MLYGQNHLSDKTKYLFGSALLLLIPALCLAFTMTGGNDFDISRREILLRRIGHEILLRSGDSESKVLPVNRINENEYQLSFEKEFTFETASLVKTIQQLMAQDPLASDYVVNVLENGKADVIYGFAISKNRKNDIVACKGRKQPKASYVIDIKFKPPGISTAKSRYLLSSLPFLAFVGFIFLRSRKPGKPSAFSKDTEMFTLSSVLFDVQSRQLTVDGNSTDLTGTEARLLRIFAKSPNQVIERSRLQKEIWEDEGIIVGRSLDMFISKLRKKLEVDANVKIVVVRRKGYKLEIST